MVSRSTPLRDLPSLLTPAEFGAVLGVSRGTQFKLAKQFGVKVGRLIRIPRERVIDIFNDSKTNG